MKSELSRVTVEMPKSVHRRLKTQAAYLGKSLKQVILDAIEETDPCRSSTHIPNKETRKAIKDVKAGRNLVRCKNVEELFKKLGMD